MKIVLLLLLLNTKNIVTKYNIKKYKSILIDINTIKKKMLRGNCKENFQKTDTV